MIRYAILALGLTLLASPAAAQGYRETFDALDERVRTQFYDPHFGGRDWAAIRARYRKAMVAAKSDAEFQRLGQKMLEALGVSHVALRRPGAIAPAMGLAALTETIDGSPVVVDIDPASGARAAGLRIGDRILDPAAVRGPRAEAARLEIERCDGSRAWLSVPREAAYWPPRQRTIAWSVLLRGDGRSVGYLRADRFEDDAAELIDAAMDTLGKTDGLLIDIRNNSGGNASALRLLAYFAKPGPGVALLSRPFLETLDGPVTAGDLAGIDRVTGAYTTEAIFDAVRRGNGATMLMIEDIGARRYDKPVVILIGPETGSAAEGFAWGAKAQSDAILIGRETAGALLSSEQFDLPGGWRVTLPVHGNWGPDGRDYGDRRVPPGIAVPRTRAAICRGEDADLAAGVAALEGEWRRR
jgi:carboxyl-terminal processing protease